MSSKRYYIDPSYNLYYPDMEMALLETVQYYICGMLYPDEPFEQAKGRFRLADFDTGNDAAIRKSIEFFKSTNAVFPFTAYTLESQDKGEYKTVNQISGKYYSEYYGCYISAIPVYFSIPMISFFTTPRDYYIAYTKIQFDNTGATRLNVPIMINGKLASFGASVEIELSKGDLAFALSEQLRVGNIYNINHTFRVLAHIPILTSPSYSEDDYKSKPVAVNRVESMVLALEELESQRLIDTVTINTIPAVTSSNIVNGSIGVAADTSIVITFNVPMNEQSVFNNIVIIPNITYNASFNIESKILTIVPFQNLDSETEYEVSISTSSISELTHPLGEEYTLRFTTV